jgi:hypothetical protein
MAAGVVVGRLLPSGVDGLRGLKFGHGSQINLPIAVLTWLMITSAIFLGAFSIVLYYRLFSQFLI